MSLQGASGGWCALRNSGCETNLLSGVQPPHCHCWQLPCLQSWGSLPLSCCAGRRRRNTPFPFTLNTKAGEGLCCGGPCSGMQVQLDPLPQRVCCAPGRCCCGAEEGTFGAVLGGGRPAMEGSCGGVCRRASRGKKASLLWSKGGWRGFSLCCCSPLFSNQP